MANVEDWALVVGITSYPDFPGLNPLKGAEADAMDFYSWVTAEDGGDIPDKQAKLLVTSQFIPHGNGPAPSKVMLDEWLQNLLRHNGGGRAGRRLYLFYSGHGFAPDTDQVACLTAEATELFISHIHGDGWATDFYNLGKFDEVVLFADCCRTTITQAPLMGTGVSKIFNKSGIRQRKRFYGLAAPVTQAAMQTLDKNSKPRGVFTLALMDGLRGKAADNSTGVVGSTNLENFLNNYTSDYLPERLRNNQNQVDPEIENPCKDDNQIVFCHTSADQNMVPIKVNFPTDLADGTKVNIFNANPFKLVAKASVINNACDLELPCGHFATIVGDGDPAFTLKVSPTGDWELGDG